MTFSRQSLYRIPIIGWLVKDAVHGHPDAKYYLLANVVALLGFLIYQFGYPFVIVVALTETALALGFLIYLTASDVFKRRPAKVKVESIARDTRRNRRIETVPARNEHVSASRTPLETARQQA